MLNDHIRKTKNRKNRKIDFLRNILNQNQKKLFIGKVGGGAVCVSLTGKTRYWVSIGRLLELGSLLKRVIF